MAGTGKMPRIIYYCLYHGRRPVKYFQNMDAAYNYLSTLQLDNFEMSDYRIEKLELGRDIASVEEGKKRGRPKKQ